MSIIDLGLDHDYKVEIISEIPFWAFEGSMYAFGGSISGHSLLLKIYSKSGKRWIGSFPRVNDSENDMMQVLASPVKGQICVVAGYAAYLIDTEEPENYSEAEITPVFFAKQVKEYNLLVIASFIGVACYRYDGLAWTKNFFSDDLKIEKIEESKAIITGWISGEKNLRKNCIDLFSGDVISSEILRNTKRL